MTSRREYAISLGLAKPTRGRLSQAAQDAIAKAESEGMTFTETQSVKPTVNGNPLPAEPKPEKEPGIFETFAPTPDPIRSGYLLFRKENGGTIKVNASEVCQNCMSSFAYCFCRKPTFRLHEKTLGEQVYTLVN
jgi:hypothetical protein